MKMTPMFLALFLVVVIATAFLSPNLYAEPDGDLNMKAVVKGNTAFAIDLYGKLKDEKGNLFFSPYSISTALAMTYAGARGNTERQMAEVLHFTLDQKELHPAFFNLQKQLNTVQQKEGIELNIANALWAQKDYVFLSEFLDLTDRNYGAVLNQVDFKKAREAARRRINTWGEQKTKNKIKDLIGSGDLSQYTRLVLTNAIYFKGDWESQFEKNLTKEEPFRLTPDKSVKVPMMTQKEEFGYMENDNLQILEIPYVKSALSMVVLLPKKNDGLPQLESMLNGGNLNGWLARLRKRDIEVFLPKFKTTLRFSLRQTLTTMDMSDAFIGGVADFSGMDGSRELYIFDVIHKAFVDVNEEGTEAAAATGVVTGITSALPQPPPVFRADHPFVFLIRHNTSGSIIFLGRILNPLE